MKVYRNGLQEDGAKEISAKRKQELLAMQGKGIFVNWIGREPVIVQNALKPANIKLEEELFILQHARDSRAAKQPAKPAAPPKQPPAPKSAPPPAPAAKSGVSNQSSNMQRPCLPDLSRDVSGVPLAFSASAPCRAHVLSFVGVCCRRQWEGSQGCRHQL